MKIDFLIKIHIYYIISIIFKMFEVFPIESSSFNSNCEIGLISIPNKCFTKTFTIKDMIKIFELKSKLNYNSKSLIKSVKIDNIVVLNEENCLDAEKLEYIVEKIKITFESIEHLLENHIQFFIIKKCRFIYNYGIINIKIPEEINTCLFIIKEQTIYNIEKKASILLKKNFLISRWNPNYKFCRDMLHKQYDECIKQYNDEPKSKKARI